jgi:hypothetical protein
MKPEVQVLARAIEITEIERQPTRYFVCSECPTGIPTGLPVSSLLAHYLEMIRPSGPRSDLVLETALWF